jgi:hypothetical protein
VGLFTIRASFSACAPGTSRDSNGSGSSMSSRNPMRTTLYTSMIVIFVAVASLVVLIFAAPRFDWSATAKPGRLETTLAQYLVVRWI